MSATTITISILVACAAVSGLARALRWKPSLRTSLAVALALRVLVAVLSRGRTPADVRLLFDTTAVLVAHGRDPLTQMPRYQWNFLPTMPYVWSVLSRLHLPWEATDKAVAIAADCVNTVLVAALATTRKRQRAFQYAVSPLALLIVGWHGQLEPIALACGLAALVVLRRRKDVAAGALVGLGVAIKTWPILFALAVLRATPRRRWRFVISAIVGVPLAVFVTMPLFLDVDLVKDARFVLGYRSVVGVFGWTGVVALITGVRHVGYTGTVVTQQQHIAVVLLVVVIAVSLWLWRRASPDVLMLAVLLGFLGTTAGWGTQYLMWPLPLAIAYATRRTWLYVWPSSVYAAIYYLHPSPYDTLARWSIPVVVGIFLALPLDQRVQTVSPTSSVAST